MKLVFLCTYQLSSGLIHLVKGGLLLYFVISVTGCTPSTELPTGDPENGGLFLPDDFEALVVVDSIGRARHLVVHDNGDIYVRLSSSDSLHGGNIALRDTTNDGKADIIQRFGTEGAERTTYGTAMLIHEGYLYYSSATVLFRQQLTDGKLIPESEKEIVLQDDHAHGVHWHITKPVSFDRQGYMYVPFGAPSNACQDLSATPNGAPDGEGLDPCPELEEHGGIWRFEANKTGLTQKDGSLYATGIRSVVAMDWNPVDEHVYVVMHGRDNLHSLFPDRFSPWQSAVLPSEEFLKITEGADYGWPYCYYDQIQKKKVLAPEYGGDGNTIERCADMDLPVMGFPGHWAPNDVLFYEGNQFPERYKNGAFIAFHGSTNRAPYPQSGYIVAFVPFENGTATGKWEVFADGFTGVDTLVNTSDAQYRPVGLAEGPDGSLYITESNQGKIWRVMYKGDSDNFGESALAQMEDRKLLSHIKTPDVVEDDLQKNVLAGQKLYNTFCATCHQQNGRGAIGRFPPLAATDWVSGDKERLINIVLNGLEGSIEVNGELYNSVMPQHRFLSDEEIAEILSFIRQNFGNNASVISAEEVKAVRN
ncbi:c-type cytochrome [Catalinimonas niigatensis]|uniref:c-type cytochrome n=1 Tax=Catalinimonas niigatensis TaxID=1397264 RepID=UPI0026660E94|nr:c-type cytochrome [Catalinimonas niigatensis]WPP51237.1 PQQ-dependent sugar dehydrogenase [Catalinimonas niigatensis]